MSLALFDLNEGVEHDRGEMEIPSEHCGHVTATVSLEVRRSVRTSHHCHGHPSLNASLRMPRLGGASTAALEYAQTLAVSCVSGGMSPTATLEDNNKNYGHVPGLEVPVGFCGKPTRCTVFVCACACWNCVSRGMLGQRIVFPSAWS